MRFTFRAPRSNDFRPRSHTAVCLGLQIYPRWLLWAEDASPPRNCCSRWLLQVGDVAAQFALECRSRCGFGAVFVRRLRGIPRSRAVLPPLRNMGRGVVVFVRRDRRLLTARERLVLGRRAGWFLARGRRRDRLARVLRGFIGSRFGGGVRGYWQVRRRGPVKLGLCSRRRGGKTLVGRRRHQKPVPIDAVVHVLYTCA